MIQVKVRLTEEQNRRLQERSAKTGAPVAAIVRMALDQYIDELGNREGGLTQKEVMRRRRLQAEVGGGFED